MEDLKDVGTKKSNLIFLSLCYGLIVTQSILLGWTIIYGVDYVTLLLLVLLGLTCYLAKKCNNHIKILKETGKWN